MPTTFLTAETPRAFPPTPRSQVRRRPQRAAYDEATVCGILDAGIMAHVGYVIDGQPFVTPTAYWREGRKLYWHGATASRMLATVADWGSGPCTVIGEALLLLGALLTLLSAVGMVRFDDVFARMHALAKASTAGVVLMLGGAALELTHANDVTSLIIAIALQLLTSPVAAHRRRVMTDGGRPCGQTDASFAYRISTTP